ncbi:hypothetical protein [Pseudotabrizicola sp. 4114]|uniref:hypothetical protein n=1 Tax=Pseudotabrizicola sp. 4114 TaxID=2817731 RepID=UPI002857E76C|nr:hypothetical protein [Pseudorhodobacter sp. 4114]
MTVKLFLKFCAAWFQQVNNGTSRRMVSIVGSGNGTVHLIDQALAVADSRAALAALVAAVDTATPDSPLGLELSGDTPTAPALQLLIAAARGLAGPGAFSGFGACASRALGALSIDIPGRG